jgi:hypothetical protein
MADAEDVAASVFARQAMVPTMLEELRTEIRHLRAEVAELRRAAPPAVADVDTVAKMTGLSVATVRRRVEQGVYRRAPGGKGRRCLIDLASLREPDNAEAEIARLAAAAREGR